MNGRFAAEETQRVCCEGTEILSIVYETERGFPVNEMQMEYDGVTEQFVDEKQKSERIGWHRKSVG